MVGYNIPQHTFIELFYIIPYDDGYAKGLIVLTALVKMQTVQNVIETRYQY